MTKKSLCELCGRESSIITKHHLIPVEKGGRNESTADLCPTCHNQIHALYTNSQLSYRLYTIERLKNDDKIKKYLSFIKNHPGDKHIPIKKSKEARRKR